MNKFFITVPLSLPPPHQRQRSKLQMTSLRELFPPMPHWYVVILN
jgi:hypothetical protein